MITKGTIEEKILKLQDKKQSLFDSLIDDTGDSFKKMS
jgi:SNF2 family DNA or RNA helicase